MLIQLAKTKNCDVKLKISTSALFWKGFLERLGGANYIKRDPTNFLAFLENDAMDVANETAKEMKNIIRDATRFPHGGLLEACVNMGISDRFQKGFRVSIFDKAYADSLPASGLQEMSSREKTVRSKEGDLPVNKDVYPSGTKRAKGYWRILEYGSPSYEMSKGQVLAWIISLREAGLERREEHDKWRYVGAGKKKMKALPKPVMHPGVHPIRFLYRGRIFAEKLAIKKSQNAFTRYKYANMNKIAALEAAKIMNKGT